LQLPGPCCRRPGAGEPAAGRGTLATAMAAMLHPGPPECLQAASDLRIGSRRCYVSVVRIPSRQGPAMHATTAAPAQEQSRAPGGPAPPERLVALDAFRGLTMMFLAMEVMRIPEVAANFPDWAVARLASSMMQHREWVGCSAWDLIMPAFMFMVGVSLAYSASRRAIAGQDRLSMYGHAAFRAAVLIGLGVFVRSASAERTMFTFNDVLSQIGLGYMVVFALAWATLRVQWIFAIGILIAWWAAFALFPLPAGGVMASGGVPPDWPHHLEGLAAHWNINANFGSWVDVRLLNLFPGESPFLYNPGGYVTLNFVPSIATMVFGLVSGQLLLGNRTSGSKLVRLFGFGIAGIIAGTLLHALGVSPLVKRLWTTSWVLYSAGWVTLLLGSVYYVTEVLRWRAWAYPLVVVGMNSLAMYMLTQLGADFIMRSLLIHVGAAGFQVLGQDLAPALAGLSCVIVMWLLMFWMYRRKIFLRV
jgi:heparan-alpha-glucosaminide N-acetyltransferase